MSSMIYMSTYTATLEALNEFDGGMYGAMEGADSNTQKIEAKVNENYAQITAELNQALHDKNQKAALAAVDKLENVIDNAIKEMDEMPKDRFRGIQKAIKLILAAAGVFLMFKTPAIRKYIMGIIGKTPIGSKILGGISKAPKLVRKVGGLVADMTIWSAPSSALIKGAKMAIDDIKLGSKEEFVEAYGDKPNASSGIYRQLYTTLQNEKKALPMLREEIVKHCKTK